MMILVLLSLRDPFLVFSMSFPAFIFGEVIRTFFPISVSAFTAIFFIAATIGALANGYRFRLDKVQGCFLALIIMIAASLRYSYSPDYGKDKIILLTFVIAPVVILGPILIDNLAKLRKVFSVYYFTLSAYVLYSLFLFILRNISGRFGALHDPIFAGQIFGATFLVSFILLSNVRGSNLKKIYALPVGILALYFSLMSGTRAAVFAGITTICVYYWLIGVNIFRQLIKKPLKSYISSLIIIIVFLIIPVGLKSLLPEDIYLERYSSIDRFFYIGDAKQPDSRTEHYMLAIDCFKTSPLTGIGVGGYKAEYESYKEGSLTRIDSRYPVYPHNIFLEIASEEGIIAVFLFLIIIIFLSKSFVKIRWFYSYNKSIEAVSIACLCFYGFIVAQTSLDISKHIFFWWGMGNILAIDRVIGRHVREKISYGRNQS